MMKRSVVCAVLGCVMTWAGAGAQIVSDFDDIQFWVGDGANRAGLVIGFNDGAAEDAFVWGYRWDGTASGARMLSDIAEADTRLDLLFGGTVEENFFVQNMEYTDGNDDNHFAPSFGYFIAGGTASGTAIDGGGTSVPTTWTLSPSGASESNTFEGTEFGGRLLADGAWDGWFAGNFPPPDFEFDGDTSGPYYAAVPEPTALLLILVGGLALLIWKRERCA